MLPDEIAMDIRDRPYLISVDKVVHYIQRELSRYNDKHLSQVADNQGLKDLDHGPKNPVNSLMETEKRMMTFMPNPIRVLQLSLRRGCLPLPETQVTRCLRNSHDLILGLRAAVIAARTIRVVCANA